MHSNPKEEHVITGHVILVCHRIFCDSLFITCYFELKLTYVSSFFMYRKTKFQQDPTKDIEFTYRPPLSKSLTFGNVMYIHDVAKSERF